MTGRQRERQKIERRIIKRQKKSGREFVPKREIKIEDRGHGGRQNNYLL